jgi:hypothetical protein
MSSIADKTVQERDIVVKLNLGYPNPALVLDHPGRCKMRSGMIFPYGGARVDL